MSADAPALPEHVGMLRHVDRELELDFIREFSTGGEMLQSLSIDTRRERIRLAIYTQKLPYSRFRDGPLTYAQAYAECYGRPLEMRGSVRHPPPHPTESPDETEPPDDEPPDE